MQKIFLLPILLCSLSAFSQYDTTKWNLIWTGTDSVLIRKPGKAEMAMDGGRYSDAIKEFKQMLTKDPSDPDARANLAGACALNNEKDSAFRYLDIFLASDSSILSLTNPDLYNLIDDPRWNTLEDRQLKRAIARAHLKPENAVVIKQFISMHVKDQALYSQLDLVEKTQGRKSRAADSVWKIKEKLNQSNLKALEKIIAQHGWPKRSVFGYNASSTAFLIIQHSDDVYQKKYLPQLEAACKAGEASWQDFALMKDRVLVSENKPQLYGSQVHFNEKTKSNEFFPIEDPEHVDKRRAALDMEPLGSYAAHFGFTFDVPQKK